jgi:predicted 3-demethylubiquinone-9 3-methyltransferase (glyoxalase superfamily)
MPKITTFLTFNDQAETAVQLYTSVFKNSKIIDERRWGKGGPGREGTLMTATIELDGTRLMVLNGGPSFHFAEGVSLFVSCDTQAEIDELWAKLSAGGQEQPCGWLTDKFGVSWQIIPKVLGDLLGDRDPAKAGRAMTAMLKMQKLDIAALKRAHAGEA